MTLEARIREAFANGADEITVRVSRYEADCKTPAAYQALVKKQNRTLPWNVGVRANPVAALEAALHSEPPAPEADGDVFG